MHTRAKRAREKTRLATPSGDTVSVPHNRAQNKGTGNAGLQTRLYYGNNDRRKRETAAGCNQAQKTQEMNEHLSCRFRKRFLGLLRGQTSPIERIVVHQERLGVLVGEEQRSCRGERSQQRGSESPVQRSCT